MSSEVHQGTGRTVIGDSGDFTYRLIDTSMQNLNAVIVGNPSNLVPQKNADLLPKGNRHSFDLTSHGNLIEIDAWEAMVRIALENLSKLMLPFTKDLPFLLVDLLQDIVIFMEEYVKQKINLKMDALADFFGVLCDTEQQIMFKALLRTYSNKVRTLDYQEIEKMRTLYKSVITKSIMAYKTSTEGFCQRDYVQLTQAFNAELETSLLSCLDLPEFEEILHFLHEASLFLLLAYHPQGFALKPKEARLYKVRILNTLTMTNIINDNTGHRDQVSGQQACVELIPETKAHSPEARFKAMVLPLGSSAPYKMILEHPTTLRSIFSCLFQGKGQPSHQESTTNENHENRLEAGDADTDYRYVKDEKMITFESSSQNVRARIEGRQKKSVTFSDRDSVFEFDSNQYCEQEADKQRCDDRKQSGILKLGIENKENRGIPLPPDRQNKKVLNLKELQLNPKHFIGRRQNKAPKLRLIHDSEESIDSLKPAENKITAKRPSIQTDLSMKDTSNNTSFFKNLNISKEEIQNKVMSKTALDAKKETKEPAISKKMLGVKSREGTDPPIIKIELPSSVRAYERSNSGLNLHSDGQKYLTDITMKSINKDILVPNREANKSHSLHFRSSSAQNLDRLKQTRSNMDFMNQLSKRSVVSSNLSEVSDSSAGRFGRSLSAGRRMLTTVLKPGGKEQSGTSITDSFRNHHLSSRDDKIAAKSNVLSSKLNFLNYDKQSTGHSIYPWKTKDRGLQLDLSIYQKILCGRSKAMPQTSKTPVNRIR